MKTKKKSTLLRNLLLGLLLAGLCIGAAELFFCREADPELYDRITAPVCALAGAAGDRAEAFRSGAAGALSAAKRKWEESQARAKAEKEAELASRAAEEAAAEAEAAAASKAAAEEEAKEAAEAQIASTPLIIDPISLAGPEITRFTEEDGREILTGGNYRLIYYNQGDEEWASQPFGIDPIGKYGCGPTALAMLVSSMTEHSYTPAEMAAWAAEEGYASVHYGAYHAIVPGTAEANGLSCVSLAGASAGDLYNALAMGGMVVALMGPGHFTNGGHFILLHGVTLTGDVLVADPNSRDNSLVTWNPELILAELSSGSTDGGPLWLITDTEHTEG